jgi:hypothetical protein
MPTYTLISSNVLASSAASVTFSAIPSTYTDLVLRVSTRGDGATNFQFINFEFNADASALYSYTSLRGNGVTVASNATSSQTLGQAYNSTNGDSATANTFSNSEFYIPNYTSTTSKPISSFGASENNATDAGLSANAHLFRNTSAITSIKLWSNTGANWIAGSSFYLYGISNA